MSKSTFDRHHIQDINPPINAIDALSVDNLIFGIEDNELKILLVLHNDPIHQGKWAFPGGWTRNDESLHDSARRLLEELTGIRHLFLEQLKAFGCVDRFPNKRVITVAYYALVSTESYSFATEKNTSSAAWHNVTQLPELVYDHSKIISYAIKALRQHAQYLPICFKLLPEKFTFLQLQNIYEAIFNIKLDKSNFRRKILRIGLLKPCNEKQQDVPHRAANLFKFNADKYQHISDSKFTFKIL